MYDPFQLTNEQFKELVSTSVSGEGKNNTLFFDVFELFYADLKNKSGERKAQTIHNTISKLRDFDPGITFEQIDEKFYRNFIAYCERKGMMKNYIGSIIRDIKRVMEYAAVNKVNSNKAYEDFKRPREKVYNIYLGEEEIRRMEETRGLIKTGRNEYRYASKGV